jgi:hypothetical protein
MGPIPKEPKRCDPVGESSRECFLQCGGAATAAGAATRSTGGMAAGGRTRANCLCARARGCGRSCGVVHSPAARSAAGQENAAPTAAAPACASSSTRLPGAASAAGRLADSALRTDRGSDPRRSSRGCRSRESCAAGGATEEAAPRSSAEARGNQTRSRQERAGGPEARKHSSAIELAATELGSR